jgi:hypothetical protein
MNKLQAAMARDAAKYEQARDAVETFIKVSYAKYDSHSYATGYMGSKIAQMASAYLTKTQFAEFLQCMKEAAEKQQTA